MVNPASYEPIVSVAYTKQPSMEDAVEIKTSQTEQESSDKLCICCYPVCFLAAVCACFIEVCCHPCDCEEVQDI